MSQRVNKYRHHLKFLSVCDSRTCKEVIKRSNNELIKVICECALNVLHGNVPLTPAQRKSLSKHKRTIRNLATKQPINKKKTILQKGGGFLPVLLGPILGILSSILAK